jgi:hypothetical protein
VENEGRRYQVSFTHVVGQAVERIAQMAVDAGRRAELANALREIVELLETQPLEWGDPEHHTRLPGGMICHGIRGPLLVRYAVYESHRVVILAHIQLVSAS